MRTRATLAAPAAAPPVLRRQDADKPKPAEKEAKAGKVLLDGLKIAAEEAGKDKVIKEKVLKPIEKAAAARWARLSGGDQAAIIGFGAVTYGVGLGGLLGSAEGRKVLSGVNILAPTALIPYWPVTKFVLTPPKDDSGAYAFKLGFDGDAILQRIRDSAPGFPIESLKLEAGWTVDAAGEASLTTLAGKLKLRRGIGLSGGLMQGPLVPYPTEIGVHDDRMYMMMRSLPEVKDERPNIGGLITVDLAQLLPGRVGRFLGGNWAPEP